MWGMNREELKATIQDKWPAERLGPLDPQSLDHEVREIISHACLVNEMGRMVLFDALKNGHIDAAEFKRRALTNKPGGVTASRF